MGIQYSDGANLAVRVFLRELGVLNDRDSLNRPSTLLIGQRLKSELRDAWNDRCAYCAVQLGDVFDVDHVVPINQVHAGLHCIANLVPACKPCNKQKKAMLLQEFLAERPDIDSLRVNKTIEAWYLKWGGNPSGNYISEAQKLYKEVSALIKRHVIKAKG